MASTSLTDSLRKTLAIFDGSGEPLTTPEVAETLDLERRTTYARLEGLVEAGRLETKKVGASARVWWRPSTGNSLDEHTQFESLAKAVEEYAIFTLDPDGRVQSWNTGAERIKGYEPADILDQHVSTFYPDEDVSQGVPEENLATARAVGSLEDEGWRVRADGTRFWARVTITAIRDADGHLEGFVKITRDMTERREYERRLEAQTAKLERERDDLASELDEVFDRIEDGFYALDEAFRFLYLNDHAKDVLSVDDAAIGEDFRELVVMTDRFEAALHEALETQEPVIFDDHYDPVDRWFHNAIYPSASGLSVYFREITEEKHREHELQRYETTVETVWDGVVTLDADDRFVMVNEAFCAMTGYERGEILGEDVTLILEEETIEKAIELHDQVEAGDRETAMLEYDLQTKEGGSVPVEARFGPCEFGDGTLGGTGVIRDISERKQREHELERQQHMLRHTERLAGTGGWETDIETGKQRWTLGLFDMHDIDVEEPDPRQVPSAEEYLSIVAPEHREAFRRTAERCMEEGEPYDEEIRITTMAGRERWIRTIGNPITEDGEIVSLRGAAIDITEQRERERALARFKRAVESSGHAIYMTDTAGEIVYVNPAFEAVTGYTAAEALGQTPRILQSDEHDEAYYRNLWETVRNGDIWEGEITARRKDGELYDAEQTIAPVTDEDGKVDRFVAVQNDISDRKQRERTLERQREELAALNDINDIVSTIATAVVDQSTREEIEQVVCNALAETEVYEFAWLAAVDSDSDIFRPRASAGTQGYVSDITVTMDPDDPRSEGPGATAVREQETQVIQDVYDDGRFEPWREAAVAYGFNAVASIPVMHEGTVYGVLGVYADRENAFGEAEREIVSRLGALVGHAIAAAERKRAVMSDELVELEFQLRDAFCASGVHEGAISLDYATPVGDDVFVGHGTATPDAIETLPDLAEAIPHWTDVTIRSEGDPANFEVRLSEPPVLTVVSDLGGYFDKYRFDDGDWTMTIHLAATADTRRVIDSVTESYPAAEMVRRQQITRPRDDPQRIQRRLVENLTDRQRAALDAAYHAGYFEWPRDADGSDIAESFGVSVPTFHQHLRKAEKKILDSLYAVPAGSAH